MDVNHWFHFWCYDVTYVSKARETIKTLPREAYIRRSAKCSTKCEDSVTCCICPTTNLEPKAGPLIGAHRQKKNAHIADKPVGKPYFPRSRRLRQPDRVCCHFSLRFCSGHTVARHRCSLPVGKHLFYDRDMELMLSPTERTSRMSAYASCQSFRWPR